LDLQLFLRIGVPSAGYDGTALGGVSKQLRLMHLLEVVRKGVLRAEYVHHAHALEVVQ
jgi:hypothetical protein